ncbi:MAG TPA: hypothetical protein VK184_13100 [Nostocaceae cyanobacterium]|nr:hypothetical protein [Nostocaceae cyanobacterium]
MKKLTSFLAIIFSFLICFSSVSPAFAQTTLGSQSLTTQTTTNPPVFSLTNFYSNPDNQAEGVKVYNQLGYDVIIPNQPTQLPPTLSEFNETFPKILQQQQLKNGINGSFTKGRFDFQAAVAQAAGDELFEINAPLNGRLFTVVAGLPASECPLKIADTQIAFYDTVKEALVKANELSNNKYLVYVSPSIKLTTETFGKIFYDSNGNQKIDPNCFIVSGATEKATVDYRDIFFLLPPRLQQPAKLAPFVFSPKPTSPFIYLVNARKNL